MNENYEQNYDDDGETGEVEEVIHNEPEVTNQTEAPEKEKEEEEPVPELGEAPEGIQTINSPVEGKCPIASVCAELEKVGIVNVPRKTPLQPHRQMAVRIFHKATRHTIYGECHIDVYDKQKAANEIWAESVKYLDLLKEREADNAKIKAENEF